mmetsp:Transcript_59932/g.106622  ORF Transcript_59932/g.106622 Transcript_59932/m.106622 type:complete len:95 (+) Transcript_59932:368-652(+)
MSTVASAACRVFRAKASAALVAHKKASCAERMRFAAMDFAWPITRDAQQPVLREWSSVETRVWWATVGTHVALVHQDMASYVGTTQSAAMAFAW